MKLGKVEKVDLREVWKHEASGFSKWLAEAQNIQYLNETINLNLVEIQTEKNVGGYKCDVVCRDEFTDKVVIIENQLESTNHDHLGKIITYASGLDASVIIWIVKVAREEHSSAIEWLNSHTDENISFFLIQIEVIKIGDSLPAPQFKIIEAPNDFNKKTRKSINEVNTESEAGRLEFWTVFNDVMRERKQFNTRKPSTDHWYHFSIGTSTCHLSADLLNKEGKVRINMWIPNSKAQYDYFFENKDSIESSLGMSLDWDRIDNKKASRICTYIDGFSFSKPSEFENISHKMIDRLVKFRTVFQDYILK